MQDEREVALRAKQGDQAAFEVLVRRYEDAAFRVAYLIVRDEAEAQDVTQEGFVRAYRSLDRFDVDQPFRPWLLRIVSNAALNVIRGARRRSAMRERYEQQLEWRTEASPAGAVEAREEARRVWEAVGTLRPEDQAVVYLRYFLEASEQETAEVIGRPVGTVKSRLHRALRRLRDVIAEDYPDLALGAQARTGR